MPNAPTTVLGITQAQLERFQQLQADIAALSKAHDELNATLRAQLAAGAPIQDGVLTAELLLSDRRVPDWKEAFIQNCGAAAAEAVKSMAPVTQVAIVKVHKRPRLL